MRRAEFSMISRRVSALPITILAASTCLMAQPPVAGARLREFNNRVLTLHSEARRGSAPDRVRTANLFRVRAEALRELIEARPQEALSLAFPKEAVDVLAAAFPEAAPFLETSGEWPGILEVLVFDDARMREHHTEQRLLTPGGVYRLFAAGGYGKSGDPVLVRGVRLGDRVAAAEVFAVAGSTGAVCATTGPQSTAVIVVTYPGVTPPVGNAALYNQFFGTSGRSLDGYWMDASYGTASASGNVFGPYTLPQAYTCDQTATITAAAIAAADPDIDYMQYNRIFIVVPNSSCSYSGASTLGCGPLSTADGTATVSKSTVLASYMTTNDGGVQLAAHEGGHALGLKHARSRDFGADSLGAVGASGAYNEYGDNFSPMGYFNLGHYAAQHKAQLGWLPSTNVQTVQGAGTYLLQPFSPPSLGTQALKIERDPGSNNWLWLEYRQPIGPYEATLSPQVFSGALVRYSDALTGPYTDLLDLTPATASWLDPALAAGRTWVDPYTKLSLTAQTATAGGLTVQVNYGTATCAAAAPSIALSPANPSVSPAMSATYSATIRNNDSAACAPRTMLLTASQPAGWTAAVTPSTVSLLPGQTASVTLTETVAASAVPGTYSVGLIAQDGAGIYSAAANLTVMAPSAPLTVSVLIPSTTYTRKSSVSISATVLSGATPAAGVSVSVAVKFPNGATASGSAVTAANGAATYNFRVGPKDPLGLYTVTATIVSGGQSVSATGFFTVR
jgi:M6 family metalloprotease-like protein